MPREDYLVFGRPSIDEAAIAEVVDSLRSGWIGTGPKVRRFERALEDYVGVQHVRCVSSCTAALVLAMRALEIGPGDEVVLPTFTFVATANAVELVGARPVLVDSDRDGNIDLDLVAAAVTPRTKALVVVHLAGRPVDLDRVRALQSEFGFSVIEDAAHALGAEWGNGRIGGHGNLTAFSFYATKNVTTGEGGALATDDLALAERVERLALHGLTLGAWQRFSDAGFRHYECEEVGLKYNMTDLAAAIGLHQLPRLDEWIDERARLWDLYDELLAGLPLTLPAREDPGTRHARHLYQVLVDEDACLSRDDVAAALHRARIGCGVHYRAVHLQPYYRDRYELRPLDYPCASALSERTLSLPLGPDLLTDDLEDVAEALRAALRPRQHGAARRVRAVA